MPDALPLQPVIDVLADVDAGRPADAVLSGWFREHRQLRPDSRGAIVDLTQSLLRHHARLGWWLARHGREGTPRNRLLAWLILSGGRTARQVEDLVNASLADLPMTARERGLLVKLQGSRIEHDDMPEDVRLECPSWAAPALRQRFGADFNSEMTALLQPPPLDLRVNALKATRPQVLEALAALGIEAEPTAIAPHGIRIAERLSLARLPMLRTGETEIQDEGSQLVAMLLDARPGERVVDFCAGAGGKTLAIAAQMANRGKIVACDISEGRLRRASERFRGAGVHNVETRLLSSESDKWVKRHKAGFDRVLIDAPCSGTGTWRRNPDARWRSQDGAGLANLTALQARILASAARLVKPGGRLVYATCSLLPKENEAQVERFLASHPDFKAVPLAYAVEPVSASTHSDFLSLSPARHGTDGFFAAIMQREAAPQPASETP